jgi:mRNA-degrading endonuclease RelE of RelBE toxin-antitoxin system
VPSLVWTRNARGYLGELSLSNQTRIGAQVDRLRKFPRLGIGLAGPYASMRRLIVGNFAVIYDYDSEAERVTVIAISYAGARGGAGLPHPGDP